MVEVLNIKQIVVLTVEVVVFFFQFRESAEYFSVNAQG